MVSLSYILPQKPLRLVSRTLVKNMNRYISKTLPIFWVSVTLILCLIQIILGIFEIKIRSSAVSIRALVSVFLIWNWVYFDAGHQQFHRPFSFGMFIQLYWWALIPWYLVKTRGWKGLLWLLSIVFLFLSQELFYRIYNY